MEFQLFDPSREVEITSGRLPHWYQLGVTYFVTFRTDDSIPRAINDLWWQRRDEWLSRHGIDPRTSDLAEALELLPASQYLEFHRVFSEQYLEYLDRGYGKFELANSELAGIVADTLCHFDGVRYVFGDFVVMPNHVHLLGDC